jgi:hypothetical protein
MGGCCEHGCSGGGQELGGVVLGEAGGTIRASRHDDRVFALETFMPRTKTKTAFYRVAAVPYEVIERQALEASLESFVPFAPKENITLTILSAHHGTVAPCISVGS